MSLQDRKKTVQKIKSEIDLDRLAELLAQDYIQQAAQDLKNSVENAERG